MKTSLSVKEKKLNKQKLEAITGVIDHIFFSNHKFSAGKIINDKGESIKFAGSVVVSKDERIIIYGTWTQHKTYGKQFEVKRFEYDKPTNKKGLSHYLSKHPRFKGIGKVKADLIVDKFGDDFENFLNNKPEQIANAAKIPFETIKIIQTEWKKSKEYNQAITELHAFELTHNQVTKIIKKLGNNASAILKDNPYILIGELTGFGFKKVDKIAIKLGISKLKPERLRAGILYCIDEALEQGHCYLDFDELIKKAESILILDSLDAFSIIAKELDYLIQVKELKTVNLERELIARPWIYNMEKELVKIFNQGFSNNPHRLKLEKFSKLVLDKTNLYEDQNKAFKLAIKNKICLISGGAGAGKTFLSNAIKQVYEKAGLNTIFCAPTGKAAKRLEQLSNSEALTIHRLLGYNGREFQYSADNQIDADVVIIDECFDYSQKILTENGWEIIGKIVNRKEKVRVWSRNSKTGRLELKPILRWKKSVGPNELYEINVSRSNSTRNARIIRCTPDHKILTPYGYRRARELKEKEEIIVRGYQLTKEQRSILIGSLLGDGHLCCNGKRTSPQACFMNGDDQLEYLKFKHDTFGVLAGKINKGKSGYTDKPIWNFNIAVIDELYEIADEIIIAGNHNSGSRIWTPTNKFLDMIDEQALAIWYLDNGSINKCKCKNGTISNYITIHSNRFSEETHFRFVYYLYSRFEIMADIAKDGRGYFRLRFNKENSDKLLNTIQEYIPSCMSYKSVIKGEYKYITKNQIDTCIARVRSIKKVKPSSKYVFDIEVADNHNYVAGNVIASNCSMVPVPLAWHLMTAINLSKTAVIMIGDHNQLPPVGCGNVLRDLIKSEIVPTVILKHIVRQAGILKENSISILNGKVPSTPKTTIETFKPWYVISKNSDVTNVRDFVLKLYTEILKERFKLDLLNDVQLLTPTRKGVLGVNELNIELQKLIQKKLFGVNVEPVPKGRRPKFLKYDKIIQRKNNYQLDIMNGSIGQIKSIDKTTGDITAIFDDKEVTLESSEGHTQFIQLAYALTIHQCQGSEFPVAINIIHKSHSFMHHRNLFYTGVTRAQKSAIIIGDRWGVSNCAKKREVDRRKTFLSFLCNGVEL